MKFSTADLSEETLQDEIAVSVARVLASANRKAKELGIDVGTSLITARAAFDERRLAVARAGADARDYVGRRGGDLMIDIDPTDTNIKQILRGQ